MDFKEPLDRLNFLREKRLELCNSDLRELVRNEASFPYTAEEYGVFKSILKEELEAIEKEIVTLQRRLFRMR